MNHAPNVYDIQELSPLKIQLGLIMHIFRAAGQFVCAVRLRGGNGLRLSGEVPGTGRPVHQRGSVPAIRCSFSEE